MTSANAEPVPRLGEPSDLVPLGQLIRGTPDVHPIESIDELRSDAFETDEELEEFLSFVTRSRHADLAWAGSRGCRPGQRSRLPVVPPAASA